MKISLPHWVAAAIAALALTGCHQTPSQESNPLVTSVDQTAVKRQSIGNCWIYAQATWLESLLKTESDEDVNVSESYWTWWNWYDQIVDSNIGEIQTGGWWWMSANIAMQHGWVTEGQFIDEEAGVEMSLAQSRALDRINTALKPGGRLAKRSDRTPAKVREVLDWAYGTDMAAAEEIAIKATETIVGHDGDEEITLADALAGDNSQRWNQVSFPRLYGEDATPSAFVESRRKAVLKRVFKALNDRQPVVMSLMIDFNALDTDDQTFKASTLADAGAPGRQGGHMVVLHDYVVENVPGVGTIGEGDVTDELKTKALEGDMVLLKAKNSWGTNRPDRGLTDGYTRFDRDYLTGQLEWTRGTSSSFYTTLTNFVLPPGY